MSQRALKMALLLAVAAGTLWGSGLPDAHQASVNKAPIGSLAGVVADARGVPQMGAAVMLLSADGRVLQRLLTNERGAFLMARLSVGRYNLRVTLANFLPSFKENVVVEAGGQAFLSINLASLSDTLARLTGRGSTRPETDEDWKWVIRSSGATRPVLRLLPGMDPPVVSEAAYRKPDYHARVEFQGGGGRSSSFGSEADFSTAFGYSQSLFHGATLLLGGNVGYQSSAPATAFRSVLRHPRSDGTTPEISVTVRQVFLPDASFMRMLGRTDNLQSLSTGYQDEIAAGPLRLAFGGVYDSISFLDRLNTISSFGKASIELAPGSQVSLAFYQGIPRQAAAYSADPLRGVTSDLSLYPRLSVRDGTPAVQRGRHVEAGFYQTLFRGGTLQVSAYRDKVDNWAIAATAGDLPVDTGDFLPDVFTQNYSFNAGNHHTSGTRVSYQQKIGANVDATVGYAYGGMLATESRSLASENLEGLRDNLRIDNRHSLAMKVGARVPGSHTRLLVSYKWVPGSPVIAGDLYDQTAGAADASLNISIRQPLPQLVAFAGRMEALADFRNLMAQGYIPVTSADGRRVILLQQVRSFRGGVSFNF